jgi:hypothetical protein
MMNEKITHKDAEMENLRTDFLGGGAFYDNSF